MIVLDYYRAKNFPKFLVILPALILRLWPGRERSLYSQTGQLCYCRVEGTALMRLVQWLLALVASLLCNQHVFTYSHSIAYSRLPGSATTRAGGAGGMAATDVAIEIIGQ